jgi:hypothetical protein
LQSPLASKLTEALQADTGLGSARGAALPYSAVKGIRSHIGELLSDPNLPADIDTATLKRIYGGLSEDLKNAAADKGIDAISDYITANDATKAGHGFIDSVLRPIMKEGVTPEQAASKALSMAPKGGTSLSVMRQEMPDAVDALAAYTLRERAARTAGGVGDYSPQSFDTKMSPGKLAPEADNVLFSSLPPTMQRKLTALREVASRMKDTDRVMGGKSPTAGILGHGGIFALPAAAATEGFMTGDLKQGLLQAAAAMGSQVVPGLLGSQLLSRPGVTRFLSNRPGPMTPFQPGLLNGLLNPPTQTPRRSPLD